MQMLTLMSVLAVVVVGVAVEAQNSTATTMTATSPVATITSAIDCTISTLNQCGDDWATRLQQPLTAAFSINTGLLSGLLCSNDTNLAPSQIIGLIAGGAILIIVIIPGLIFCCVKRLLCFAIRVPGKAVSAAFSATAAVSSSNRNDSSYNNISSQQQQQQRNYNSKNINSGDNGSRPLQNKKKKSTQFNDNDDSRNNRGQLPSGGGGGSDLNPSASAYKSQRSQPYPQPPNTSKNNYQSATNQQQPQEYGNVPLANNNAAYAYPVVNFTAAAAAAAAAGYTPSSGQLYYGVDPSIQNIYAQQQYAAQWYNVQQYNPYEIQQQQIFQQQQQYQPRFIPYDPSQQQQLLLQQQEQQPQPLLRQPSRNTRTTNTRQQYQQVEQQQQQQATENNTVLVQPTQNLSKLPRKLNKVPTAVVAGVGAAAPRAPTHPRVAALALATATANATAPKDVKNPTNPDSPRRDRFDSDSSGTSADNGANVAAGKQLRDKQQQIRIGSSPSSGGVIARGSAGAVFLPPPPPESPELSVANRARTRDSDDAATADVGENVNTRSGRPPTTSKQHPKQRDDRVRDGRGEETTGADDDSDNDLLSNYIDENQVVVHEGDAEEVVVEPRRPAADAARRRPRRQSLLESEARKQRLEIERIEEEAMRARGGINAGSGGFSPAVVSTPRSNLYRSSSDGSASTSRRAAGAAVTATGRRNVDGQWASDVLDVYDANDLNDSPFGQQKQVQRIPGRTPAVPLFKPIFQEQQQQQQQQQQRPPGISSRELARQQLQRERDSAAIAAAAAAALIKRASRDLTIGSDTSVDNPANDTSISSRRTSSNKRLSREYVKEASVGFAHRLHVANKRVSRELIAAADGGVTGRERAMKRVSYELGESSGNSSRRDSGSGNYSRMGGGAGGSSRERGKRVSSDAGSGSGGVGGNGSDQSAVANAFFEEYAWMGGRQGLQQQQQQGSDRGRAPIQQQQRQQQSVIPTGQISISFSGVNETSLSPARRRVVGNGVGDVGGGDAEASLSPRRRAPTGEDGGDVDRNRNRW